jgi:hypothetical protein
MVPDNTFEKDALVNSEDVPDEPPIGLRDFVLDLYALDQALQKYGLSVCDILRDWAKAKHGVQIV